MNSSNNHQFFLKLFLAIQILALTIYTFYAIKNEGLALFQIAIDNVLSMTWNGQFNADFSCYLVLSGLWIMWRNEYKLSAIIVAILAMILGIIFFATYLFYLLITEKGNLKKVLVGNR
jgi:hypothetical protein